MKVIAHQTIGMHLPTRFPAILAQSGKKLKPAFVIPEDVLALVSTIHDVINRSGVLNAEFSRHLLALSVTSASVNSED